MVFGDLKDSNGTTLQSYGELLLEKAKEHSVTAAIVYASKELKIVHSQQTIAGSPALAFMGVGMTLYGLDVAQQRAVFEALENQFGGPQLAGAAPASNLIQ